MLKLNSFALFALALLPIALIAQAPAPSATQAQTADVQRVEETAIERAMKDHHAAIPTHDGTRSPACSCPTPISG
jgi:hypothetical protein